MPAGVIVKFDVESWQQLISGKKHGLAAGGLRSILLVLSFGYGLVMIIRNWMYSAGMLRQHRVDVPVVVVGNLTVGGTGKTPVVEWIARYYRQLYCRVTLLSRGYQSTDGQNDEAMLLEANLVDVPHLQGRDRVALAKTAIEELESELLLLDDGFQHRRLARNIDIVLIDVTRPWGYGYCLPRGMLREPLSGLRRAGLVLLTRTDQIDPQQVNVVEQRIKTIVPNCPVVWCRHAPLHLQNSEQERIAGELDGKRVAAFCGIGNAESFYQMLRSLNADMIATKTFPDHHNYTRTDVESLAAWSGQQPEGTWIITTQKDWVKLQCNELGNKPLWFLRIGIEVTRNQQQLESSLQQAIGKADKDCPPSSFSSINPLLSFRKDAYDSANTQPV